MVLVPESEPVLGALRAVHDRSAVRGAPAHVTLLYPFRHPDAIDDAVREELRGFFAGEAPFDFSLDGACGFPGVLYLAPEPPAAFERLARALAERHPDTPPYGGAFADPIPHLTVAQSDDVEVLAAVYAELERTGRERLPLLCRAERAHLLVKRDRRWRVDEDFSFDRS